MHSRIIGQYNNRLAWDREVSATVPVVFGTMFKSTSIADRWIEGESITSILSYYPGLIKADVWACLAYALPMIV